MVNHGWPWLNMVDHMVEPCPKTMVEWWFLVMVQPYGRTWLTTVNDGWPYCFTIVNHGWTITINHGSTMVLFDREPTNQQIRRIAIPPGGGNNLITATAIYDALRSWLRNCASLSWHFPATTSMHHTKAITTWAGGHKIWHQGKYWLEDFKIHFNTEYES